MLFSFKFEVRQIMLKNIHDLQSRRHFYSDANPYPPGRRGLRRNRNVWRSDSFELSHLELESTQPNKALEPTASSTLLMTLLQFGTCSQAGRGWYVLQSYSAGGEESLATLAGADGE